MKTAKEHIQSLKKETISIWESQGRKYSESSALWYAVRDYSYDDKRVLNLAWKLFRVYDITDLTNVMAKKLYNSIDF